MNLVCINETPLHINDIKLLIKYQFDITAVGADTGFELAGISMMKDAEVYKRVVISTKNNPMRNNIAHDVKKKYEKIQYASKLKGG